MRALLDTNIILDVLQQREPWFHDGQQIFLAIANKQIIGCITAKEANDIQFFSKKQFKGEEFVDKKARTVLSKLFALFEVIDTLAIDCRDALAYSNSDYEDAVMIKSAERAGVDCIITRNLDHYKSSPVSVYSPDQFLSVLAKDASIPKTQVEFGAKFDLSLDSEGYGRIHR